MPGFGEHADWREAMRYYYACSLAKLWSLRPEAATEERRAALVRDLRQRQRPDGSWQNPSHHMREDDPLIATSLAVTALAELLRLEEAGG